MASAPSDILDPLLILETGFQTESWGCISHVKIVTANLGMFWAELCNFAQRETQVEDSQDCNFKSPQSVCDKCECVGVRWVENLQYLGAYCDLKWQLCPMSLVDIYLPKQKGKRMGWNQTARNIFGNMHSNFLQTWPDAKPRTFHGDSLETWPEAQPRTSQRNFLGTYPHHPPPAPHPDDIHYRCQALLSRPHHQKKEPRNSYKRIEMEYNFILIYSRRCIFSGINKWR